MPDSVIMPHHEKRNREISGIIKRTPSALLSWIRITLLCPPTLTFCYDHARAALGEFLYQTFATTQNPSWRRNYRQTSAKCTCLYNDVLIKSNRQSHLPFNSQGCGNGYEDLGFERFRTAIRIRKKIKYVSTLRCETKLVLKSEELLSYYIID